MTEPDALKGVLYGETPFFLARHPGAGEELIQVCADLTDSETMAREVRALVAASAEHPRASLRLLVLDRDAPMHADAPGIESCLPTTGSWRHLRRRAAMTLPNIMDGHIK